VTLSRAKRFQAAAIAAVGCPVIEAFGGTYHWRASGVEHLREVMASGRQPIIAFWHGRICAAILYFRDRDFVVLTSQNFDGEWIARLIGYFGYSIVRGSSSRGGARALAQLRREMAKGLPVAITVDGPRGPSRVAQPGAIWLAGATGNPIVPFHIEASEYWTAKSWDSQQVPKPGSAMAIAISAPIDVPFKTDAATLEAKRVEVEVALRHAETRAREMVAP
jgi:hypothetical protein